MLLVNLEVTCLEDARSSAGPGELDALVELLSGAAGGRGCLVLVQGPAGVGKTRLVEESVAGLDRAFRVGHGYAADDLGTPPLWPWTRACSAAGLGAVVSELSAVPASQQATEAEVVAERLRWMTSIVDVLLSAASDQPVLLVLEDLHWADSASLELLRHVAAAVPAAGLALVVTSRAGAADVDAALGLVRRFPATHELQLEPLSVAAVAEYLAESGAAPSAAGRVHRDSGGLPLLLTAARPGHEGATPYDVRSIVLAMLTEAGGSARPVLEAAAVLGDGTDEPLLGAGRGRARASCPSAPSRPVFAAVCWTVAGRRFAHALLREGVTAALATDRVLELHRRSGMELARHRAPRLERPATCVWPEATRPSSTSAGRWLARPRQRRSGRWPTTTRSGSSATSRRSSRPGAPIPTVLAEARLELAAAQYLAGQPARGARGVPAGQCRPRRHRPTQLVAAAALVVRGLSFPEANETVIAAGRDSARRGGSVRPDAQPAAVPDRRHRGGSRTPEPGGRPSGRGVGAGAAGGRPRDLPRCGAGARVDPQRPGRRRRAPPPGRGRGRALGPPRPAGARDPGAGLADARRLRTRPARRRAGESRRAHVRGGPHRAAARSVAPGSGRRGTCCARGTVRRGRRRERGGP